MSQENIREINNIQLYEVYIESCSVNEESLEYIALTTADKIVNSEAVYNLSKKLKLEKKANEQVIILGINNNMQVTSIYNLSKGNCNTSIMSPFSAAQFLIKANCNNCIVVHNHPSESLKASQEDITSTKRLKQALNLLEINLLDHIIVTNKSYVSMRERNWEIWEN